MIKIAYIFYFCDQNAPSSPRRLDITDHNDIIKLWGEEDEDNLMDSVEIRENSDYGDMTIQSDNDSYLIINFDNATKKQIDSIKKGIEKHIKKTNK